MFNDGDGLGGVVDALEVTFNVCGWENSISVDVNQVNVGLCVPKQRQLFACLSVLGEVTILADIPGSLAVTSDSIVLHDTLAVVLARIWSTTWIHELAVVQSDFTDDSFSLDHKARFDIHAVDSEFTHAADETGAGCPQAASDDYFVPDAERQSVHLRHFVSVVHSENNGVVDVRQLHRVPLGWIVDLH